MESVGAVELGAVVTGAEVAEGSLVSSSDVGVTVGLPEVGVSTLVRSVRVADESLVGVDDPVMVGAEEAEVAPGVAVPVCELLWLFVGVMAEEDAAEVEASEDTGVVCDKSLALELSVLGATVLDTDEAEVGKETVDPDEGDDVAVSVEALDRADERLALDTEGVLLAELATEVAEDEVDCEDKLDDSVFTDCELEGTEELGCDETDDSLLEELEVDSEDVTSVEDALEDTEVEDTLVGVCEDMIEDTEEVEIEDALVELCKVETDDEVWTEDTVVEVCEVETVEVLEIVDEVDIDDEVCTEDTVVEVCEVEIVDELEIDDEVRQAKSVTTEVSHSTSCLLPMGLKVWQEIKVLRHELAVTLVVVDRVVEVTDGTVEVVDGTLEVIGEVLVMDLDDCVVVVLEELVVRQAGIVTYDVEQSVITCLFPSRSIISTMEQVTAVLKQESTETEDVIEEVDVVLSTDVVKQAGRV